MPVNFHWYVEPEVDVRVNTEIDHYSSCTKNGENGCYIYLYISDVHISGRNLNFPYISLFSVFHRRAQ